MIEQTWEIYLEELMNKGRYRVRGIKNDALCTEIEIQEFAGFLLKRDLASGQKPHHMWRNITDKRADIYIGLLIKFVLYDDDDAAMDILNDFIPTLIDNYIDEMQNILDDAWQELIKHEEN